MSERLFARLAARLAGGETRVAAHVIDTRGAVPRRRGAVMLVGHRDADGSIGGGEAEARVLAAARALLSGVADRGCLDIDLSGRPDSAGICGGWMQVALRRWRPPTDTTRVAAIALRLAVGDRVELDADDLGATPPVPWIVEPDARLLIVGAGHCGEALHRLARELDFDAWVHDARADCFVDARFEGATALCGGPALLERALATPRPVFAVLLNRDFAADVAALEVIAKSPPAFLGMMGSRRRIAQVRAALPHHADVLAAVHAPVGLDIAAQSPEEIAVSILAQLVAARAALRNGDASAGASD
ncbi:MAG: XdhC family protein [Arenimonas sp.]